MGRYVVKRLLMLIPVVIGVSFLIFALMYFAPGDPAAMALGESATPQAIERWNEEHGLNNPFFVQYGKYMYNIITEFDFGTSYRTGRSVTDMLIKRFPVTLLLALPTTLVSLMIGAFLGIMAAKYQGTWIDTLMRVIGMFGVSMPGFWLSLMMMLFLAVKLRWLPVSGFYGPKYLVLPIVSMTFYGVATLVRITRSSMLDCSRQDYVRTARAKGQSEGKITRHHILRNALIPIVTSAGQHFGAMLGGSLVQEQIFNIPGLGILLVSAINNRDYPQIRGSIILLAVSFCLVNLLVDIIYAYIDPRIKAQYQGASRRRKQKREAIAA